MNIMNIFNVCIMLYLYCLLPGLIIGISGDYTDTSFQEELLTRIQALEKQGKEQTEKMQTMEVRLENQDKRLAEQHTAINEQQERIKELERTVNELQSANAPHTSGVQMPNKTSNGISKKRQTMTVNDAMKHSRLLLNAEGPVAFHAVITGAEVPHIGLHQPIVFPNVLINFGAGYHNLHGIFIAPKPGLYIFATSILSFNKGHVLINVHLMKNGNVLANVYAHSDSGRHDQGSVTVVTQLTVGDEVWVGLYDPADTSLYGDSYSSFMGCLVYPM